MQVLSFAARGAHQDGDDSPALSIRGGAPKKSPAGARKDAALNNQRRDSVKKQYSSMN